MKSPSDTTIYAPALQKQITPDKLASAVGRDILWESNQMRRNDNNMKEGIVDMHSNEINEQIAQFVESVR